MCSRRVFASSGACRTAIIESRSAPPTSAIASPAPTLSVTMLRTTTGARRRFRVPPSSTSATMASSASSTTPAECCCAAVRGGGESATPRTRHTRAVRRTNRVTPRPSPLAHHHRRLEQRVPQHSAPPDHGEVVAHRGGGQRVPRVLNGGQRCVRRLETPHRPEQPRTAQLEVGHRCGARPSGGGNPRRATGRAPRRFHQRRAHVITPSGPRVCRVNTSHGWRPTRVHAPPKSLQAGVECRSSGDAREAAVPRHRWRRHLRSLLACGRRRRRHANDVTNVPAGRIDCLQRLAHLAPPPEGRLAEVILLENLRRRARARGAARRRAAGRHRPTRTSVRRAACTRARSRSDTRKSHGTRRIRESISNRTCSAWRSDTT